MATTKPDLTRVWANGAPPANVVDPDTTTPGKFNAGWQAEVPPFEHFNFLQQLFTQGLAYINEQGIGIWDTDTSYPVGAIVKGSDSALYKAIVEQNGNDPVSDGGTNWERYKREITFLTAEAAIDSSILVEGDIVMTGGRKTVGDKGEAKYVVVAAATGTDDGFTYLDNSSSGVQLRLLNPETANFKVAGVIADGVEDDTAAFETWVNATRFPSDTPGAIRITSPVVCSSPLAWVAASPTETYLVPDLGTTGGKALSFETNDVHVENVGQNGNGLVYTLTANQYGFFGGDGTTKFKNHKYLNNRVENLNNSDGLTGTNNLIVSHALYVDNVDNVTIKSNELTSTTGAAIFVRDITNLECTHNDCTDNVWYPIHVAGGLFTFNIDYNRIIANIAQGVFYGGGIDMMNQHSPKEARSKGGTISFNHFEGNYSYGGIMRILSCEDTVIEGNTGENLAVGSINTGLELTAIRIGTRGVSAGDENGPVKNMTVKYNKFECPDGTGIHRGVYVGNQFQVARVFATGIRVFGNEMRKNDSGDGFSRAYIFHGFEGGLEDIWLEDNYGEVDVQSGQPVDGAIGFVATNAQGKIERVTVGGNRIVNLTAPVGSTQTGLAIGQFVDRVTASKPNKLDNFWYSVRTFTNSGPTLEYLNDIETPDIGSLELLLGVPLSKYRQLGEVRTTAELDSISDNINTQNKWEGKQVFNSDLNKPVYATGGNPNSTWNDGAGANTHNPS